VDEASVFAVGCPRPPAAAVGLGGFQCPPGPRVLLRYDRKTGARGIVDRVFARTCARCLVAFGEHLYWTDLADGTLRRRRKDGSGPGAVLSRQVHQASRLVVTPANVFWSEDGPGEGVILAIPTP
jgi:hypothetical protein